MRVEFQDKILARLDREVDFTAGYDRAIIRGFRKVVQVIRAARDERDLYALKSLHFEKLKGNRAHQRSLEINAQWRIIAELAGTQEGHAIVIVKVEDYH